MANNDNPAQAGIRSIILELYSKNIQNDSGWVSFLEKTYGEISDFKEVSVNDAPHGKIKYGCVFHNRLQHVLIPPDLKPFFDVPVAELVTLTLYASGENHFGPIKRVYCGKCSKCNTLIWMLPRY